MVSHAFDKGLRAMIDLLVLNFNATWDSGFYKHARHRTMDTTLHLQHNGVNSHSKLRFKPDDSKYVQTGPL